MKVVILSGGTGTRLREVTEFIPKALVPIGGRPMIWHIMKIYAYYGFRDFVLALGYKQEAFKEYFRHFNEINNDVLIRTGYCEGIHITTPQGEFPDDWIVRLSDTGINAMKGARLKKIQKYIVDDTFMCTYGDAVSDINITNLLAFHHSHGKIATITGVHPKARFGEVHHDNGYVQSFTEKPNDDKCLMNGGFMVFHKDIFDLLSEVDTCDLELGVLDKLAQNQQLMVYHHKGFWACMDNYKEMTELQFAWDTDKPPWKVW